MNTDSISSKVWSFCHTLRDDGVRNGDYLEQLTYLIFLKMADEYAKPPYRRKVGVPAPCYDYRTNIHHTLKRKSLRFEDLADFIAGYNPENRKKRKETWHPEKNPDGPWRRFPHAELAARDKTSLDLFWLKDDSLADLENLPEPSDLAEEIIENVEAGLVSFRAVASALAK